jgi:hypothetical protein
VSAGVESWWRWDSAGIDGHRGGGCGGSSFWCRIYCCSAFSWWVVWLWRCGCGGMSRGYHACVPYSASLIVVCVCDGSRCLGEFAMSISIGLIVVTYVGEVVMVCMRHVEVQYVICVLYD